MENYYKSLIHVLPDIVYQIDEKGRFVYINESVRKLGYEPDELRGVHFSSIIAPAEGSTVIDRDILILGSAVKTKEPHLLVNERRTGKRITKHLSVRLVAKGKNESCRDCPEAEVFATGYYTGASSGIEQVGTIGIIREKNNVDKSQKIVLQVERYYRMLSDNSSEIILLVAHDGTILSVSDSIRKNRGIEPIALIGENIEDIIHPDDIHLLRNIFSGRISSSGKRRRIEIRLSEKAGGVFETSVTPVTDAEGAGIACWIFNAMDITLRKTNEAAQQRRERIYKTLLRVSPDAIVLFDAEGDAIMANDMASAITGMTRDEIIGMHYLAAIPEENRAAALKMKESLIFTGAASDNDIFLIRSSGEKVPLEVNASMVNDSGGVIDGFLAVFRDVTEKKKAAAEKQRIEDELLQIIVNRLSDREVELLEILARGYSWPDNKK
ncbi:MAG: PAS domain S-box protein, partial [Spirochaetota bacterium]